jgi:hypothetical protein
MYEILRDWNIRYITEPYLIIRKGEIKVHTEIKELSRIICNDCEEKEYEKCRDCRVYQLLNKIAER